MKNVEDVYPLSPMQSGMLFHSLSTDTQDVYIVQLVYDLCGPLDLAAFKRAWEQVVARHSVLRTAFVWAGLDEPLQVVRQRVMLPWDEYDWRGLPRAEQHEHLREFLRADRERRFDLARAPLLRVAVFRLADEEHRLVWSFHHLLLDGWSMPLLLREILAAYEALCRGEEPAAGHIRPYREYIAWLQRQDLAAAEAFWRRELRGFTTPTPLRVGRTSGNAAGGPEYAEQAVELSESATAELARFARRQRLTLGTLVQGAWAILLSRYSGERDVLFGTTVAGRPAELPGVEAMVGPFINTLPLRARVEPGAAVGTWLRGLQGRHAELRRYEYSPLARVQTWSEAPRGRPLFDSLVVLENYPDSAVVQQQRGALEISFVRSIQTTNYPLTVVVFPASSMRLSIRYHGRRFEPATIARLLEHFRTVLEGMVADPERPLSELPLLTEAERRQVLVEWNATAAEYPRDRCIHELFEAQAQRTPDAVAVVCEDRQMSYRELNARANRLAHHLRGLGVGPDVPVGICLERSVELVVGLLGVLKAGGAYLPLDPAYPRERLAFLVRDAGAAAVLTREGLVGHLSEHRARVVCVDADRGPILAGDEENPIGAATAENLAYLIYTSGSTGTPKGVMIEHRSLANLVAWHQRAYRVTTADRATLLAAPAFDASVWELWPHLAAGASVYIADERTRSSPTTLLGWLAEQAVTICFLPTPLAEAVLDAPRPTGLALRVLLTGGDTLRRWPRSALPFSFVNHYGPTEGTVVTTSGAVQSGAEADPLPPIGRPIANTRVYVLDGQRNPVPVGVAGELYIGGDGLARGYLNRPELTAEAFIPNPLAEEPGARLYRSGDLVRWRADGSLEFLGRLDDQVKVRGSRVEPGEVEAALMRHPAVGGAAVVARDDAPGERRLVAYVVPRPGPGPAPTPDELRSFLQRHLPEFMVPVAFVTLGELPLTPSGKIDRRALPPSEQLRPTAQGGELAPRNALERRVAEIWEEILGVRHVSVTDDFFELGGHSLLAFRLLARIEQAFGRGLPMASLLQGATVENLARLLAQADASIPAPPLVALQPRGAGRPFFCVHNLFGDVSCYEKLARHLGQDRPFYALQPPGLNEGEEPGTDIGALATYHVERMRSVQPQGPYSLGGLCSGGIVAFEMACQLRAQGQPVALLAIFDGAPPGSGYGAVRWSRRFVGNLLRDLPSWLIGASELTPDQWSELLRIKRRRTLAGLTGASRSPTGATPRGITSRLVGETSELSALTDRHRAIAEAMVQGFTTYRPPVYPGSVTLLRPRMQPLLSSHDRDNAWGRVASGGVEVRPVPGNHLSMLHEPHVRVLAEELRACLARAEAGQLIVQRIRTVASAP